MASVIAATILGAEIVVQQEGVTSPWNSVVPPDIPEKVFSLPHVSRVSSIVLGKTRFLGASYFLVFGVGAADPILSGLPLLDGKAMTPGATQNEILVGSWAAERFELAAGDRIEARACADPAPDPDHVGKQGRVEGHLVVQQ